MLKREDGTKRNSDLKMHGAHYTDTSLDELVLLEKKTTSQGKRKTYTTEGITESAR
jgi:hypothetical protein